MNDSIGFPKASWEILPLIHTVSLHCVCVCVRGEINGSQKGCDRERNELNRW